MIAPIIAAYVMVATMCAGCMGGIGFIARPSRETLLWSIAFGLAAAGGYVAIAAEFGSNSVLFGLSMALSLNVPTFVWAGLRSYRGERITGWPAGYGVLLVEMVVLTMLSGSDAYPVAYRTALIVSAVFAVLTVRELALVRTAERDVLVPLGAVSIVIPIFALWGLAQMVASVIERAPLDFAQVTTIEVTLVSYLAYLIGALATMLLLIRPAGRNPDDASPRFNAIARERLGRAQRLGDQWWSLLDISLDNITDLRTAFGPTSFRSVASEFTRTVRDALPAEADLCHPSDTQVLALIPSPPDRVRLIVRRVLEHVADVTPEQPTPFTLSASVGWVTVDQVGYGLDSLTTTAREAASEAARAGGNRWIRADRNPAQQIETRAVSTRPDRRLGRAASHATGEKDPPT